MAVQPYSYSPGGSYIVCDECTAYQLKIRMISDHNPAHPHPRPGEGCEALVVISDHSLHKGSRSSGVVLRIPRIPQRIPRLEEVMESFECRSEAIFAGNPQTLMPSAQSDFCTPGCCRPHTNLHHELRWYRPSALHLGTGMQSPPVWYNLHPHRRRAHFHPHWSGLLEDGRSKYAKS